MNADHDDGSDKMGPARDEMAQVLGDDSHRRLGIMGGNSRGHSTVGESWS